MVSFIEKCSIVHILYARIKQANAMQYYISMYSIHRQELSEYEKRCHKGVHKPMFDLHIAQYERSSHKHTHTHFYSVYMRMCMCIAYI